MAKKKLKSRLAQAKAESSETPKSQSKTASDSILESAHQIWLAGLGAFAKTQAEGGKIFQTLVKEGAALESVTKKATAGKVEEVRGAVEQSVSKAKVTAGDTWDKLESVFENRVAKALKGLGVPTAKEIETLTKRVEELSAKVSGLEKPKSPVRKVAAKKKTTRKRVSKKSASK